MSARAIPPTPLVQLPCCHSVCSYPAAQLSKIHAKEDGGMALATLQEMCQNVGMVLATSTRHAKSGREIF